MTFIISLVICSNRTFIPRMKNASQVTANSIRSGNHNNDLTRLNRVALALAAVVFAGLGKGKGVVEAGMASVEANNMVRVGARVKARVMAPEGWANACGKVVQHILKSVT
ncbi:hypothetical protein AAMO2058_000586800 [Amorphochlora amoebiformis]